MQIHTHRKRYNQDRFLTDKQVINYLESIQVNKDLYTCKKCNGLIRWNNADYFLTKQPSENDGLFGQLRCTKTATFLNPRIYNGNSYHLGYCYNCACDIFPEIPDRKSPLNPATNRSKVLYNVSDEDFKSITNNVCKRTLETYIDKFGDDIGKEKWKHYCEKQSLTNTYDYKKEKYGWTKEEFKSYNKSRACTLNNFIIRYGEDKGKQRWKHYIERQSYTCSLEYFIQEYGEEDGTIKYKEFADKRLTGSGGKGFSYIADEFFKLLSDKFSKNKIYTHVLGTGEKLIGKYHLDYYDETLNIAVEFYGDFWHANPLIYKENDSILGVSTCEIWERDKARENEIKQNGIKEVYIVWENDFRNNPLETLNKLISNF